MSSVRTGPTLVRVNDVDWVAPVPRLCRTPGPVASPPHRRA
jgi:hypothetical protein